MRCSSAEWIECLEMMPSWCRQVNWEWTAQFSVWKTTGKNSSEVCAIASQNCAVYSVFPSGMTSHSKISEFNWECIAPLTLTASAGGKHVDPCHQHESGCCMTQFFKQILIPNLLGISLTFRRRNFLLNFSTPVFKMWIIQELKKVALWNKRHFEEEKTESVQHV